MNKELIPCTLIGVLALLLQGCDRNAETKIHSIEAGNIKTIKAQPLNGATLHTKSGNVKTVSAKDFTYEEQAELANQQIMEHFKQQMGEEAFNNSYRGKMFNKDPKVTLNIDDHDPKTAKQLRKDLAFREANGYLLLPQDEMDDFHKTKSEIFSNGNPEDSAKFELSKLPEYLNNTYEGYTREGIPPTAGSSVKASVIRRVFNYNGSTLLLQEESSKNGSSHFTKEFVNEKIGGYPAVFNTYRSSDGKQIYELEWNTDNHRYSMESISNKPEPEVRKQLRETAEKITELNKDG